MYFERGGAMEHDYRHLIDEFNEQNESDGFEVGGGYWGLFVFGILTMVYLCAYEVAGAWAIFVESGEFVVPRLVSSEGVVGNLSWNSVRGGVTLATAGTLVENFKIIAFYMSYVVFTLERQIRDGVEVEKETCVYLTVVLLVLNMFVRLSHVAERRGIPEEIVSGEGLLIFENVMNWIGYPYFFFALACILYYVVTNRSLITLPWAEHFEGESGVLSAGVFLFFNVGLRIVGLLILYLLQFLF